MEAVNEPTTSSMDYSAIYVIRCYGNRPHSRRLKMTNRYIAYIITQFSCDSGIHNMGIRYRNLGR